jgi:translation initiation factor 1
MAKKKKNKIGVMYSTNPDFKFDNEQTEETLVTSEQHLEVWIDRKQRGGKTATLVKGFVGEEADLKALGKLLKSKCGVGGSAKDGEIIIQGNVRDKVMEILDKEGYNYKRVGG